jgi:hypothetical protein
MLLLVVGFDLIVMPGPWVQQLSSACCAMLCCEAIFGGSCWCSAHISLLANLDSTSYVTKLCSEMCYSDAWLLTVGCWRWCLQVLTYYTMWNLYRNTNGAGVCTDATRCTCHGGTYIASHTWCHGPRPFTSQHVTSCISHMWRPFSRPGQYLC